MERARCGWDFDRCKPFVEARFHELGIDTADALLDYLPFRYDDLRFPTPAARLGAAGGEENAVGHVVAVKERRVRGLEIVELQLRDDAGYTIRRVLVAAYGCMVGAFCGICRLIKSYNCAAVPPP